MLVEKLLILTIILTFASVSQTAIKPLLSAIETEKEVIKTIKDLDNAREKSLLLDKVITYNNITFFPNGTCSSGRIKCNKKVLIIGKYFTIKIKYDKK